MAIFAQFTQFLSKVSRPDVAFSPLVSSDAAWVAAQERRIITV